MRETTEEDDRITAEEAAKDETTILRESLVLLNRKMDRLAFEASQKIEALERVVVLMGAGKNRSVDEDAELIRAFKMLQE